MATSIDKKIVEMELRNRQFERNASQTLSTLDSLKKKMSFTGAVRALTGVDKAMSRMSFKPVFGGLDTVITKFNAMGVVGATVIQNLTNRAVNMGIMLGKALTIDPVVTGFQEYETKMGAIQTILTNTKSKGTTLDDVKDSLEELNTYADKTIYNFAEMTKNIGLFTAAGVGLEESTKSIKGISNLAAGVGADATTNARVMYQMSQAMSKGFMGLQDYNSLGVMGGEIFKNTAIEMGILAGTIKEGEVNANNFRDSLEKGWLNLEVMTATWQKFADDEALTAAATEVKTFTQLIDTLKESLGSGWAKSWELIVGDFDVAKALWTNVNNYFGGMIEGSADARNKLITDWSNLGGRNVMLEALTNGWKNFLSVIGAIREAWYGVFPPVTAKTLMDMTISFSELMDLMKPSEKTLQYITKGFTFLFNVVKMVVGLFTDFTATIGNVMSKLKDGTGIGEIFKNMFDSIKQLKGNAKAPGFVTKLIDNIKAIFNNLKETISNFDFQAQIDRIKGMFDKLFSIFKRDKSDKKKFDLQAFFAKAKEVLIGVMDLFKTFVDEMSKMEGSLVLAGSGTLGIGLVISKVIGFFTAIRSATKNSENTSEAIKGIGESIKEMFGGVKASLQTTLGSIKGAFNQLGDIFGNINKTMKTKQLANVAKSIGILAISLFLLALIPYDKLAAGLGAVGVLMAQLVLAVKVLDSTKAIDGTNSSLIKISVAMIALSVAVGILAISAALLSVLNLPKALGGLAILFVTIIAFVVALDKWVDGIGKAAISLIGIGIAINLMVLAIIPLALMPIEKMTQGLLALTYLLLVIGMFTHVIDNKGFFKSALSLIVFAIGIGMLVGSVMAMATLPLEKLAQGLIALGLIIGLMVASTYMLKNSVAGAYSLDMLSLAVIGFTSSIVKLAAVPVPNIVAAMGALIALLVTLMLASKFLQASMMGGLAVIGLAMAMYVLAGAVKMLASIDTGSLIKAVLAIVVLFAVLLGASAIATTLAPGIGILVIALLALGLAIAIAGAGMFLLALAIGALAASGVAGFTALSAGLMILADTIPFVVKKFLQAFKLILEFIVGNSPLIAESIITMLSSIVAAIPGAFMQAIGHIIRGFKQMCIEIKNEAGPLSDAVLGALMAVVRALEEHWHDITDSMGRLMTILLSGISQAIRDYGPQLIYDMEYISGFMAEGLVRGMGAMGPNIIASLNDLNGDMIAALLGKKENTYKAGYQSVISYGDGAKAAEKTMIQAVSGIMSGATSSLEKETTEVKMAPVLDMSQPHLVLDGFNKALSASHKDAAKMEGTINTHEIIEVVVGGGAPIQVQGANNQQQFNTAINTSNIEKQIVDGLKRGMRWEAK